MFKEVLTVLTYKSADTLIRDGGTSSWALNRERAQACKFVVCARHQQGPWKAEGPEPHKHAFLVGRVSNVVTSPENPARWLVAFDEYALADGPLLPLKSASPTQYFPSLASLSIDEAALDWRSVDDLPEDTAEDDASSAQLSRMLAAAKKLVADRLGVAPGAMEISIRF